MKEEIVKVSINGNLYCSRCAKPIPKKSVIERDFHNKGGCCKSPFSKSGFFREGLRCDGVFSPC